MNWLYHWVPKNMQGNVLMPLNKLKKSHPKIYKEQAKKYIGAYRNTKSHKWVDVKDFRSGEGNF